MYLKRIHIEKFRGIKDLVVTFNEKLNVIIGPNGSHKTTIIDAIRLFYTWGSPNRDLEISKEDFYQEIVDYEGERIQKRYDMFSITYLFDGLSPEQEGVFYSYLVLENGRLYAQVKVTYECTPKGKIVSSYVTGNVEVGQKADTKSFDNFKSYYLGALRDSTRDLLSIRNNLLGRVIRRKINRLNSEEDFKNIVHAANDALLDKNEVTSTQDQINQNLRSIYSANNAQIIGLQIEEHDNVDGVINIIRPYLKMDDASGLEQLSLRCNSLGFNNIICIATVLGDIREMRTDDKIPICALLIEEPEAHLHPQLQVSLYEFLINADGGNSSQIFITTHSPSLTSKIPLESLLLVTHDDVIHLSSCFTNRSVEHIVFDTRGNKFIDDTRCLYYHRMLQRYLDVTRSQLFFAKSCCFVEGISEALIMETFSTMMGKSFTKHEVEVVNMDGTAFGQFLMLYNSVDSKKRLPQKVAFITDEDQYTESKDTKFNSIEKLVANNYTLLNELRNGIRTGSRIARVDNMISMANSQSNVLISSGFKTLEYQICYSNVADTKEEIRNNSLYLYLFANYPDDVRLIDAYLYSVTNNVLSFDEKMNVALLMWKCIPDKAEFAQGLMAFLDDMYHENKLNFDIPQYLQDAINHIIP